MSLLLDPDQYTMIPVPLKIIKLLVLELGPGIAGVDPGRIRYPGNSQLAADSEDSDDENGDWEDVGSLNVPGLSNEGQYSLQAGFKKERFGAYVIQELLALGGGSQRHSRQTDDETYVRY